MVSGTMIRFDLNPHPSAVHIRNVLCKSAPQSLASGFARPRCVNAKEGGWFLFCVRLSLKNMRKCER
jgi:hypothetical protein